MKNLLLRVKSNLKAGITVSLVSIPLSVSLAVASQATPVVGIISAIWAGLIVSLFGGSNFNIVGPTGALSGILATYAIINGAASLPTLTILTGIFILISYLLKFERFLVYIPKSAVHGFTLGVSFIIALNQMNSALGIKVPEIHEKFIANVFESFANISTVSWTTFGVFALFLVGLLVISKRLPKIPVTILFTPVGILLGYLSVSGKLPFVLMTLGEKFPSMSPKLFESWTLQLSPSLITTALTVAVIAILETMLSAKIADGMTKTKHNKRKEMFGLGLANVVTGLFGGIPTTAALARTSLNIKSGATDKVSATISSVSIVVISFLLLSTFKFIPMSVIAAILVFVAIKMVERDHFVHLFRNDKFAFGLSMFVAFITVYEDPIIGILAGTALALLYFMHTLSDGQFELMVNSHKSRHANHFTKEELIKLDEKAHTLVYTIKGQLAYINAQAHISRFETKLNGTLNIVLRMRELYFIDLDGVEAIDEILEICHKQHREIYVTGVNPFIAEMLRHSDDFRRLESEGKVVPKSSDALQKLGVTLV